MTNKMFPKVSEEKVKLATSNVFLVSNAFVWYMLAFNGLKFLLTAQNASQFDTLLIIGVNAGAIALSGIFGAFLADKVKDRKNFLYVWLAAGIGLSVLPLGLSAIDFNSILIISLVFGLYFGLGMPITMGYHSSYINIEDRAKIGGFTFLFIGLMFALITFIQLNSLLEICLILLILRAVALAVFYLIHNKQEPKVETKTSFFKNVISNKSFVLYFLPWCMFALINFMTHPIQQNIYPSEEYYLLLTAAENVFTAVFALVSGFIADKVGRKRLSIIGFILLGMAYAVLGLFGSVDALKLNVSIFFTVTDGIAWGIFYVLFLFTIWGDLAQNGTSDKFYYLGALPYVSSYFMQLFFMPFLDQIGLTTIFSFASVFLFLAVLPLIYAPETLPDKLMKDRELKSYIENAKKKAAKIEQKTPPKKEEPAEPEENNTDYEEAKKLAEKYY